MLFNSLHFIFFFPFVVAVFFLLPHRFRWVLLLVASYYFYMAWQPMYGLLIFFSTVVDFFAAILMERTADKARKKFFLFGSLLINLGLLFSFKYFDFFLDNITPLINFLDINFNTPALSLLLPVGISFYTFQSLSYTIDVYRGVRPAVRHFGIFALYVSFFPQLVAGPIETSRRLLPQLFKKVKPSATRISSGLRLMLWGFFKKVVIADNAALIVDAVYADVTGANGIALFIATFFFAVQIYADFSGYSDIAVGAARILGYDLIINFRSPYFSRSISEFWRRWHISLMRWFKEYIYIPIGGNRVSSSGWIRNILIVFFVSGLWHGANWTFVVWGLINAFYIILEKYTLGMRTTLANITGLARHRLLHSSSQIITTFSLTLVAWVFFRAVSISDAFFVFKRIGSEVLTIISDPSTFYPLLMTAGYSLNISKENLVALVIALFVLLVVDIVAERAKWSDILMRLPQSVRWGLYYTVIFYIILAGNYGQNAFIYFQF